MLIFSFGIVVGILAAGYIVFFIGSKADDRFPDYW